MMRKERTGQSNRKYANIIIAYGSKLIHLEYRSKKKHNYVNYIIWFVNTKLHRVINLTTGTKIHTEKLYVEKNEVKTIGKIFSLKIIQ